MFAPASAAVKSAPSDGRVVALPPRDDADAQRRPHARAPWNQIPSAPVRQPDIGDEHVEIARHRRTPTASQRLLSRCATGVTVWPSSLQQRLHELAAVRVVLDEQHAPRDFAARALLDGGSATGCDARGAD